MLYVLMFLSIAFSIVKANGWFIVPGFCLGFCWFMSFFAWAIYSYGEGLSDGVNKQLVDQIDDLKKKLEKYEKG